MFFSDKTNNMSRCFAYFIAQYALEIVIVVVVIVVCSSSTVVNSSVSKDNKLLQY